MPWKRAASFGSYWLRTLIITLSFVFHEANVTMKSVNFCSCSLLPTRKETLPIIQSSFLQLGRLFFIPSLSYFCSVRPHLCHPTPAICPFTAPVLLTMPLLVNTSALTDPARKPLNQSRFMSVLRQYQCDKAALDGAFRSWDRDDKRRNWRITEWREMREWAGGRVNYSFTTPCPASSRT